MEPKKIGGLVIGGIIIFIIAFLAWATLKSDIDTGGNVNLDGNQNTNEPVTNDNTNDMDGTSQFNPDLDNGEPAPEGNLFSTMVNGSELSFRYPETGMAVQSGNTVTVTSELGESLATITIVNDMMLQDYVDSQDNITLPTTPVTYGNFDGQAYQMEDPLTAEMTEHIVLSLDDMVLADVVFQSETGNQLPGTELRALIESMQY